MKALSAVIAFIIVVVQTLLYGWIVALFELLRILFRRLHEWLARRHLPKRLPRADSTPCIKVSDPAFKRPDPMIYDQYYLMAQGLAVTWDNPKDAPPVIK